MRNLSYVQHFAALSSFENRVEMPEKGMFRSSRQVDVSEEALICPKPRRLAVSVCSPELMKPMCPWQRSPLLTPEGDAGFEIIEIFLKDSSANVESPNFGRSPPCCSPPSRAGNPIVNDVQFHRQISPSGTLIVKQKAINGPSFSASPSIRIEGFDCSRDARRDVPAVA